MSLQLPCSWKHVICCIPVLTYRKQPSTCFAEALLQDACLPGIARSLRKMDCMHCLLC